MNFSAACAMRYIYTLPFHRWRIFRLYSCYLLQASHEGGTGDPEQLPELSLAPGHGQHAAAGGTSAGGPPGRAEDPAVYAAVQDQVSIPCTVCVYSAAFPVATMCTHISYVVEISCLAHERLFRTEKDKRKLDKCKSSKVSLFCVSLMQLVVGRFTTGK